MGIAIANRKNRCDFGALRFSWPTQEPPPSPFWQLTRTMVWVCRGGNSDHGLSFLFSTDSQYFWILADQILRGLSFGPSFLILWGWGWFPHRQTLNVKVQENRGIPGKSMESCYTILGSSCRVHTKKVMQPHATLRRVLRRFSTNKSFLEGFLEGACKGFQ